MRLNQAVGVVVIGSMAFCGVTHAAGLTGTQVTGALRFVGNTDFFNPANGRVPAGFGNSSSATVTVASPLVEFGFQDPFGRITADFTGSRLTINETALDGGEATIERYRFTGGGFVGLTPVLVSNSYPVTPAISLSDDLLTITLPDGYSTVTGNTTTLTLAITLPGDADLNGQVNFNDFLALQTAFGGTNTGFTQGNFNGDGGTDFNDFLILQTNFGQTLNGPAAAFADEDVAAMKAFAASVPEPGMMMVIGLAAVGLRRRSTAR